MAYDAANITFDHERILQNFVEHGVPKEKVRVRGRVTVRVRARVGVSLTLTLALTLALTLTLTPNQVEETKQDDVDPLDDADRSYDRSARLESDAAKMEMEVGKGTSLPYWGSEARPPH